MCAAMLSAATAAAADPSPERCEAGARYAARGDLPRAALYLDGCGDAAERAVKKRLDASELSQLAIVSDPPGVTAEIDSLPGEQLTTPATVWVRAGRHEVRAGSGVSAVDVKPRTRATIVLDAPRAAAAPGTGHVDFGEENAGVVADTAPPPAVQHPPMLDCKFTRSCEDAGVRLDDPLARREEPPPSFPRWLAELRGGTSWYDGHVEPSVAVGLGAPIAFAERPLVAELRGDWSRRTGTNEWGATAALAQVVLANRSSWLSLGAGVKYSSFDSWQPVALVDVALRWLPFTVGARAEWRETVMEIGVRY